MKTWKYMELIQTRNSVHECTVDVLSSVYENLDCSIFLYTCTCNDRVVCFIFLKGKGTTAFSPL